MSIRPSRIATLALAVGLLGPGWSWAQEPAPAPAPDQPAAEASPEAPAEQPAPAAEPAPEAPAEQPVKVPDLPGPKPIPDVMLGAPLPTTPIRRGVNPPNVELVKVDIFAREKAPQLKYDDQTANFTIGQIVTGGKSGAKAKIADDDDQGEFGTLTLSDLTGTFQDGDPLTDTKGGSAIAKGGLKEGIWVLDFAFKPVRLRTIDIPGKGRRQIHYLYYRVINHTGKARMFVPQFTLITDPGKPSSRRYEDVVIPQAVGVIKAERDPATHLLGAVSSTGMIPPSTKQGIDDAVFGVAIWEGVDPNADAFSIYVRGLSDGYNIVPPPGGKGEPIVQYKALRIDFDRPGGNNNLNQREILLHDPAYEWVYYPPLPNVRPEHP